MLHNLRKYYYLLLHVLVQSLLQEKIIPDSAVCEWSDLGIQLDISVEKLKKIEKDVNQEDVVVSTKNMLQFWKRKSGKASELIKAIEDSDLVAYADTLRKGLNLQIIIISIHM